MPGTPPTFRQVSVDQTLVDAVERALDRFETSRVDRTTAALELMWNPAVREVVGRSLAGNETAIEHVGVGGRDAIESVLCTLIATGEVRAFNVFDVIKLAQNVARHLICEGERIAELVDDNPGRNAAWRALMASVRSEYRVRSAILDEGLAEAMCQGFEALLLSTPARLAAGYRRGCPAEPGTYLYLQDLETWFKALARASIRRASNASRFADGLHPLRPDDELPDTDEGGLDGGTTTGARPRFPRGSGGGSAIAADRDFKRIESLRALVDTAQSRLPDKQRDALVTKLFSPRKHHRREELLCICREVLREIPREVADDNALAALIGSRSASAAQRNYNYGRANLLRFARDTEQRREWEIILDALLPRRSPKREARQP